MSVDAVTKCVNHDKELIMLCKTCDFEYVCTKCVSTTHKGHMISPMKPTRIVGPGSKCTTHGRPFISVCRTCHNELLCWNCFFTKHKGHDTVDFLDHAKRTREKILHQPEEKVLRSKLDNVRTMIRQKRDELKTEIDITANRLLQEYKTCARNSKGSRGPVFQVTKLHKANIAKIFGTLDIPKESQRR